MIRIWGKSTLVIWDIIPLGIPNHKFYRSVSYGNGTRNKRTCVLQLRYRLISPTIYRLRDATGCPDEQVAVVIDQSRLPHRELGTSHYARVIEESRVVLFTGEDDIACAQLLPTYVHRDSDQIIIIDKRRFARTEISLE